MSREGALAVMVGVAIVLLALMAFGWWRRRRRDATLAAPTEVPAGLEHFAEAEGLYVATTRHDAPLDRLAMRHLAYRARARIAVAPAGVLLDLAGEPDVFLPADRLIGVGRATWTIDRVVERDGLVVIAWRVDDTTTADSYLRLQGAAPDDLVAAITRILPTTTSTGTDP
ncbi:hypothetical protein M4I32_01055 [Microbacterium sp. LRZ72]|uniref:PH-like domain-containing protein n=1 Tax=Microbacterium sp. LRZ72 TaxID=2942481 RepID=UPI0029B9D919|nr:hypothetical protein [Microbacterium sp. LRZ72]MDX2375389.1 hypothetical protein [Microbacterium sp. LRZ72]